MFISIDVPFYVLITFPKYKSNLSAHRGNFGKCKKKKERERKNPNHLHHCYHSGTFPLCFSLGAVRPTPAFCWHHTVRSCVTFTIIVCS